MTEDTLLFTKASITLERSKRSEKERIAEMIENIQYVKHIQQAIDSAADKAQESMTILFTTIPSSGRIDDDYKADCRFHNIRTPLIEPVVQYLKNELISSGYYVTVGKVLHTGMTVGFKLTVYFDAEKAANRFESENNTNADNLCGL